MKSSHRSWYIKGGLTILLFTLFLYLLVLLCEQITTTYNVTATTEFIECYSERKPISRINLKNSSLFTLKEDEDLFITEKQLAARFNGTVELADSVHIKLERVARGSLLVEIERENGGVVAWLRNIGDVESLPVDDILFIEVKEIDSLLNANQTIIIPINGEVSLGRSVDIESPGESSLIVRGGDITMTGYTKFTNSSFAAGSERLFLGDRLVFDDKHAIGFVSVNNEPAIQASYRAIGKEARIIKPGPKDMNSGYKFSASLFARFKYDKIFQTISILFGIVLTLTSILDFLINYKNSK